MSLVYNPLLLNGFQDTSSSGGGGGTPGGTTGQVQVNNTGAFAGISEGTTGQILTSNGAGVAPTFQAIPASSVALHGATLTLPSQSWNNGGTVVSFASPVSSHDTGDNGGFISGNTFVAQHTGIHEINIFFTVPAAGQSYAAADYQINGGSRVTLALLGPAPNGSGAIYFNSSRPLFLNQGDAVNFVGWPGPGNTASSIVVGIIGP